MTYDEILPPPTVVVGRQDDKRVSFNLMSNTLKIILFVILALAIGVFAGRFFLGGDEDTWLCAADGWVKHGNPTSPRPNVGCGLKNEESQNEVAGKYNFIDEASGATFNFPIAWAGKYAMKIKDEAGTRLIKFNYLDEKGGEQLLFLINVYPVGTKTAAKLAQEPNTKVLGENSRYIYTAAQALDMPYETGSADFKQYGAMMGQLPEIFKTFKIFNSN
jgi:hypothetical protein